MKKRELELIYMDYLNSLKPSSEDFTQKKYKINFDLKKKIIEKFKQPLNVSKEKEKEVDIKKGNVYLMFKENIPIYFMICERFDKGLYRVLKLSNYYELATDSDLLTKINDETFIIETWNSFYLKDREIEDSIFYGKIDEKDLEILTKYLNEEIEELPKHKRGLKVPLDKKYVQIKFHEKESRLVREYELRIFLLMEEEE